MVGLSLPRALGIVRADIQYDLARGTIQSPAIVFYATAIPAADAATIALHTELASAASITWIASGHLTSSLPKALTDKASHIMNDIQGVTDQVTALLHDREEGRVHFPVQGCD